MTDTYQAVYDAVRSRIGNVDIGYAVQAVLREANISHYVEQVAHSIAESAGIAAEAHAAPSAVYRPTLKIDGDQWCALYGDNLQDGVAGFGDTPAAAMADFDKAWSTPLRKVQP